MSYENSAVEKLVKHIEKLGSEFDTSSILYRLFCGEDISEAFTGVTFEGIDNNDYKAICEAVNKFLNDSKFEHMESEGGGEGEGEYCYGVIRIGSQYFKADWSYYSYNGCEYDGIEDTVREVEPKQKIITVYENK